MIHILKVVKNRKIIEAIIKNDFLIDVIKRKRNSEPFYRQSVIFFVYWMLEFRKTILVQRWPLSRQFLNILAADIGVSLGFD